MNLQDTVVFMYPELFAVSSSDVQVIRERHSGSRDAMKSKVKAATTDQGTKERTQTKHVLRQLKYPTMSPGRGATLMPTNYGRSGTSRTPGGRMGSANY